MPRAVQVDHGLTARRQIRLPAWGLIAPGAWQTCAPAVTGVGAIACIAPWLVRMILADPAGATTELAFHVHSIFDESPA